MSDNLLLTLLLFAVGLGLVIYFAEKLVQGAVGTSLGFGVSTFLISVVFLGFDPENLAVGATGLVSIEELARELPAALQGRPEISFGNVLGSILAFFLFNAGITALVRPVPVGDTVLTFYLPLVLLTTLVVTAFMLTKKVPRWGGGVLVALYVIFALGGYLI